MRNLTKLENGIATKVSIMLEGGIEREYKLAVFSQKTWRGDGAGLDYNFGYVSADGHYAHGGYSGGITGVGIDQTQQLIPDEWTLVTTDLQKIIEMANQADADAKKEKAAREARIHAAVGRINEEVVKAELIFNKAGVRVWLERDEAAYNPKQSHRWKPGISFKYLKGENGGLEDAHWMSLSDYYRKDGVAMKKKMQEHFSMVDAVQMFEEIKLAEARVKAAIDNIIVACKA